MVKTFIGVFYVCHIKKTLWNYIYRKLEDAKTRRMLVIWKNRIFLEYVLLSYNSSTSN